MNNTYKHEYKDMQDIYISYRDNINEFIDYLDAMNDHIKKTINKLNDQINSTRDVVTTVADTMKGSGLFDDKITDDLINSSHVNATIVENTERIQCNIKQRDFNRSILHHLEEAQKLINQKIGELT